MSHAGTDTNPLRVAIIGAGPAGFYAAEHLFKQKNLMVQVDLFDRLPTPFGLVRNGVAPDHPKIKSVTKIFDRTAKKPGFRFYGYVEFGKDLSLNDLRDHYHQIVYTTGAQTDRFLNIPGAKLNNHHPATAFVAWYNGHPDFRDYQFDLSQEKVIVIGIGNVAIDVARILCRTSEELKRTDIADYALEALSRSNVKEVFVLGRRGPAQAAFTTPEIKELGALEDTDVFTIPEEVELDPLSEESLMARADRGTMRKVDIIQSYAQNKPTGKSHQLTVRFLVSPTEMIGDGNGRVHSMRLARTELYKTEAGSLRPRMTEQMEELEAGLVFRSIGYRGMPLPGVPFNQNWGVILNENGRVINPDTKQPVLGEYTSGWIKRGPSGVIGTNKPDSVATVDLMMADLAAGKILSPSQPEAKAAAALIKERQPRYITYADWQKLDELELARGVKNGRPRVKYTCIEEMLAAVGK